eukprot:PhM_4_TR17373/c3_g2_i1/m.73046
MLSSTTRSVLVPDTENDLLYTGSRPVLVMRQSSGEYLVPGGLDLGAEVLYATVRRDDVVFVTMTSVVLINRGYPIVNTSSSVSTPQLSSASRRRIFSTTTTTSSNVMTTVVHGDVILRFYDNATMTRTDMKTTATRSFEALAPHLWSHLYGVVNVTFNRTTGTSLMLAYGTSSLSSSITMMRFVSFSLNASSYIVDDVQEVTPNFAACLTDPGMRCTSVTLCRAATDGVRVVCAVSREDAVGLVSFSALDANTLPTVSSMFVSTKLPVLVSALTLDRTLGIGVVAFATGEQPSVVYKFDIATLLPSGKISFSLVGLEREIVSTLSVDAASREATATIALAHRFRVLTLNLFGIERVHPSVADSRGGTVLTVYGDGFQPSLLSTPICMFGVASSASAVPATYVDDRTLLCTAPAEESDSSACDAVPINIQYGSRTTANKRVAIQRPVSPLLESLVTREGATFGGTVSATDITVSGFGFIDSASASSVSVLRCSVECAAMGCTNFTMPATYVNSSAVLCHQPAGMNVTLPPAYLRISLDGTAYSSARITYAIAGAPAGLRVRSPNTTVVLLSDVAVPLPRVFVDVVDTHGNRVGYLDASQRRVLQMSVQSSVALRGATPSRSDRKMSWVSLAQTVNTTMSGVCTFGRAAFERPVEADVVVVIRDLHGSLGAATFAVRVVVGTPASIRLHPDIETSVLVHGAWQYASTESAALSPRPRLIVVDGAGNQLRDVVTHSMPPSMFAEYEIAVKVPSNNTYATEWRAVSAPVAVDATYSFSFRTLGVFGSRYPIRFFFPTAPSIRPLLVGPLGVAPCAGSSE